MKSKAKKKKPNVNKIMSQFVQPQGNFTFKLLTVYEDYSLSVGCEQKFSDHSTMRLFVKDVAK